EGTLFKLLRVSDTDNLFNGLIIGGIGHLTSFFPERLMNRGKGYRVEGIRCFWQEGKLIFKYGEKDCDEVYLQYHTGLEETPSDGFRIYPNPTDGLLVVETPYYDVSTREYRVTNLMGQTLLTGPLTGETRTLDLSGLPSGSYVLRLRSGASLWTGLAALR
ncbi:MAG: T9SS type A sorting domain-containing protein, partial [Fibrobacterales bacterium]|nr:T9SS type A sorting domain-containing protein [Fibrobacterales bacterium]